MTKMKTAGYIWVLAVITAAMMCLSSCGTGTNNNKDDTSAENGTSDISEKEIDLNSDLFGREGDDPEQTSRTYIETAIETAGQEITMPDLVNMTWDEVIAEYSDLNLKPSLKYDQNIPKNVVIGQSVQPGLPIKMNQSVEVIVSNGPKLVEVEDYTGMNIDDAIVKLVAQGFGYTITYTANDTVQKDCVIETVPAAGEFVESGSSVECLVSLGQGNETTAVPNFINLSVASAEKRAQEYNIILSEVYEASSEVQEGHVIRQSIEPTTVVEKNTVVEIVISKGPEERSTFIKINIKGSAKGEFEFKYYIDGTLQEDMTEIMDLSLMDSFEWEMTGSGQHDYSVRVRSVETGAEGIFFNCRVDFTDDPPTKDYGDTFNGKIFKELLGA